MVSGILVFSADFSEVQRSDFDTEQFRVESHRDKAYSATFTTNGTWCAAVPENEKLQIHWDGVDYVDIPELSMAKKRFFSAIPDEVNVGSLECVHFDNKSPLKFWVDTELEFDSSGIARIELDEFEISVIEQEQENLVLLSRITTDSVSEIDDVRDACITASKKLAGQFEFAQVI